MTGSLLLATVHSGGLPTPVVVVLVIAGVGYVLWRRLRGEPLQAKRMLVLPTLLTILGVVGLTGSTRLGSLDVAFVIAGTVISAGLGAVRGATVELFPCQGYLWQRYRRVTIGLWGVLVAVRLALALVAHLAGAQGASGTHGLMLALGVSLLGEAALVTPRALATGLPFAPESKRSGRPGAGEPGPGNPGHSHADGRPSADVGWDNGVDMEGRSQERTAHSEDGWRSPGWRDSLDWLRSRIEDPRERLR